MNTHLKDRKPQVVDGLIDNSVELWENSHEGFVLP
jgi:hypothetical protein